VTIGIIDIRSDSSPDHPRPEHWPFSGSRIESIPF